MGNLICGTFDAVPFKPNNRLAPQMGAGRRIFLLAFLISISSLISAQSVRTRIAVEHSGGDQVGDELAFALREAIRNSNGYELVAQERARYFIALTTLDPDNSRPVSGSQTVASVVITAKNSNLFVARAPHTWYDLHLVSSVIVVGRDKTDIMARRVLATVEAAIEKYRNAGGR